MKNLQNNSEENIVKGDAGTAGSSRPPESPIASQPISEEDSAGIQGRIIPIGEPADDVRVRELARYFDVSPSEFRDAGKDLAEILQFVSELTGQSAMSDLLLTISQMEDAIRPSHGLTPRYKHFFNYLQEKMIEYDVRKRVRAWEV